jgi:hypothetical protein
MYLRLRHKHTRTKIVGHFEVNGKMATKLGLGQIGIVTDLAAKKSSGALVPLTADQVQVDIEGMLAPVALPADAPANAVLAFAPTGEGIAFVTINAAAYPDAADLVFEITIEDPVTALMGNLVVMDAATTPPDVPADYPTG